MDITPAVKAASAASTTIQSAPMNTTSAAKAAPTPIDTVSSAPTKTSSVDLSYLTEEEQAAWVIDKECKYNFIRMTVGNIQRTNTNLGVARITAIQNALTAIHKLGDEELWEKTAAWYEKLYSQPCFDF